MDLHKAAVAYVLADSNRADAEMADKLGWWRLGYAAAAAQFTDYEAAGYARAVADVKTAQHYIVGYLRHHLRMWGGWREDYGRPRPDDVQPRTRQAGAA